MNFEWFLYIIERCSTFNLLFKRRMFNVHL
nr:MAG TPA: hypothetical protein [Bacteriophage sp.]